MSTLLVGVQCAASGPAQLAPAVLAAPDLPGNRTAIPALARRWGVAAFLLSSALTVTRT